MFHRFLMLSIVCISITCFGGIAQASDWQRRSLADAGFSRQLTDSLDAAAGKAAFAGLHSIFIARGGKLVAERYYEGADERRGERLGTIKFEPDTRHDLRSVTKSIVSLLYGIALADGKVPGLDQPLLAQFPEYKDLAADPKKMSVTVAHALTMTLGMEWNEDLPYTDPRNSETAMDRAADRVRFVLERPMRSVPGGKWKYNGGATAVLANLIARGTGQNLFDYAKARLFGPLGITDAEWLTGPDGTPIAASGLRMRPRDLALIGQLILNGGKWNGAQLVPAPWLEQSFKPGIRANKYFDYGLHWWLGKLRGSGKPWMAAFGNGGQRLFIAPSLQLVVVITAGNYNKPDQWKLPIAVMSQIVLSSLSGR